MRKDNPQSEDELEPLVDKTEALKIRSKRTERAQKRQGQRTAKHKQPKHIDILDLPFELAWEILTLLRPSDILRLLQVSRKHHTFLTTEEPNLAHTIITHRYQTLQQCFRLPILITSIPPSIHPALQDPERQDLLNIHKKPYQHIQPPDPSLICTCLTCLLRWSALCLIPDFAHWQSNLDEGEPIPMIPRGQTPAWNTALIASNADKVRRALSRPILYARLLEEHLRSTMRSISRHAANKGNQRRRFKMSVDDVKSETDLFLERKGPPTFDFPFHRDNYYMLEAYLPNRGWNGDEKRWMYVPERQHDVDLQFVVGWAQRKAAEREGNRDEVGEGRMARLREFLSRRPGMGSSESSSVIQQ